MATGFVGSTKSFPFSFDVDVEDDEQGRSTPRLNKRIVTNTNAIPEDKQLSELDLDGLDELEDSEDEAVLEEYRRKRIAELKRLSEKPRFGDIREVSGQDYVQELAAKFPYTKFLKAVAQTCIPNFPERNLPSVFVYFEGDMKKQFIGGTELRGTSLTVEEFEYILGKVGAVDSKITEDPRPKIKDKMFTDLGSNDW
ncbi:unnamed protein product [Spodoptera littoralis]|uniref:Phosducin thioredoxin-like domain-containing protein n=1 Tax=Spodoptera littoralis TaxID=7109 RepID=A0A9P0I0J8_SPOLI|nr:unnamed protein product [Spodoptera littoralis]CAH1637958.1 unnamed protein product [Spodoptera littoralis]